MGIAAGAQAEQALRGSAAGPSPEAVNLPQEVAGWTTAQSDAIHRLVEDGAESACCAGIVPRQFNEITMSFNGAVASLNGQRSVGVGTDHITGLSGWTATRRSDGANDAANLLAMHQDGQTGTELGVLEIPASTVILDEWAWFVSSESNSIYALRLVATGAEAVNIGPRGTPPDRDPQVQALVTSVQSNQSIAAQYVANLEGTLRNDSITVEDLQAYFHPLPTGNGHAALAERRFGSTADPDEESASDDDEYMTLEVDLWGVSIFMSHVLVTDLKTSSTAGAKIQKLIEAGLKVATVSSTVLAALGGPQRRSPSRRWSSRQPSSAS